MPSKKRTSAARCEPDEREYLKRARLALNSDYLCPNPKCWARLNVARAYWEAVETRKAEKERAQKCAKRLNVVRGMKTEQKTVEAALEQKIQAKWMNLAKEDGFLPAALSRMLVPDDSPIKPVVPLKPAGAVLNKADKRMLAARAKMDDLAKDLGVDPDWLVLGHSHDGSEVWPGCTNRYTTKARGALGKILMGYLIEAMQFRPVPGVIADLEPYLGMQRDDAVGMPVLTSDGPWEEIREYIGMNKLTANQYLLRYRSELRSQFRTLINTAWVRVVTGSETLSPAAPHSAAFGMTNEQGHPEQGVQNWLRDRLGLSPQMDHLVAQGILTPTSTGTPQDIPAMVKQVMKEFKTFGVSHKPTKRKA